MKDLSPDDRTREKLWHHGAAALGDNELRALGTQHMSFVEARDVFRGAALGCATAIVAFHNHPSGDPTPSPDDVELTRRLVAARVLMGVDVVDHVVLGDVRYFSFKESRRL